MSKIAVTNDEHISITVESQENEVVMILENESLDEEMTICLSTDSTLELINTLEKKVNAALFYHNF